VRILALFIFVLFVAATSVAVYARTIPMPQNTATVVFASAAKVHPPVRILAFGDLMLDRHVRETIDQKGAPYLFSSISTLFSGQDLIVANAEGVFTDNVSIVTPDDLQFTFSTTTLPLLKQLGFSFFSQANNHALNFGWKGLDESKANIAAAGMDSFGDPENDNPGPLYRDVNGQHIAFVGYDQFSSTGGSGSSTIAAIESAKAEGAFVVVYPHWGVEYNNGTTTLQSELAHKFVDAGADVVLGGHPHVIEPIEIYKNKAIFYSMGNFIFDQPWNDTRHGLGIGLGIGTSTVTYTLYPYELELMQPTLMQGAVEAYYLQGFADSAVADDATKAAIEKGSFVLQK